jgi:hypothetical protein
MPTSPQINVTDLDFNDIKTSLKTYLSSQDKYTDWDFNGSGLNVLLDILAYNTHLNAVTAHLALNESFLDTAQLRNNVVSRAKLLGYTPRSTRAATAIVNIAVSGVNVLDPVLTLERGTKFATTTNSSKYTFVAVDTVASNSSSVFSNVVLKQGKYKALAFRADASLSNQRFEIPEDTIDTTTLRVRVKESINSTEFTSFVPFATLSSLDGNSNVFFLQENSSNRYEIYFGDGVLGRALASNNIVYVDYVYTDGAVANGASRFKAIDTIEGYANIVVTLSDTSVPAYGGAEREGIESVRFNAPLSFITQNRAVTADDYQAIIKNEFPNIQSISVWGGEVADEPTYGTVYISIKPIGSPTLSDSEKEGIRSILDGRRVLTVTPEFVDPDLTIIGIDAFVKYNPVITNYTKTQIEDLVRGVIENYSDLELNRFDKVFRYSRFLQTIDGADVSILNSYARPSMIKFIEADGDVLNSYELNYPNALDFGSENRTPVLETSLFVYQGETNFLRDEVISNSNNRNIFRYKVVGGNILKQARVGKIFAENSRVVIDNLRVDSDTEIRIKVTPNSYDIAPKRNQLLTFDNRFITVTAEIDKIAVAGSRGSIDYQTSRK